MQVGHRNVASLAGTDPLALPDQPPVTSHVAHIAFSGQDHPRSSPKHIESAASYAHVKNKDAGCMPRSHISSFGTVSANT
jgi:hypothetical protein